MATRERVLPQAGRVDARLLAFTAALALGLVARWTRGWAAPLWFDETFSATIAAQPTAAGLLDWCLHELTGPGYYGPLWLWAKLAGVSDSALRLPSLLCSAAAPVLLYRFGHRDRDLRLWWGIAAALWLPGFFAATEARPYAQIFLVAGLQSIAFLRGYAVPRRSALFGWATASALLIVTHYYALPLAGLEGLALLARHRGRLLRCWPAALPLLLAAGWMAAHLSFALRYAGSPGAWYQTLGAKHLIAIPEFLLGSVLHGGICLVVIAATFVVPRWRVALLPRGRRLSGELVLALCGLAAVAVIVALGFVRPSFTPRYLTASAPAALFGIALWARALWRVDARPVATVIGMMAAAAIGTVVAQLRDPTADTRYRYGFALPSAWIAERPVDRLVFLWDDQLGAFSQGPHMAEIGGFFLVRAGHAVPVTVVRPDALGDPNDAVLRAVAHRPRTAILWLHMNPWTSGRADRTPRIAQRDPTFECRNFGGQDLIAMACRLR